MARAPFYQVPPETYLFVRGLPDSERERPEEAVRQWAAHELLRAYGLKITDITFEGSARVGSKIFRADILIRKGGEPWIVVECKELSFKKHPEAMEQAISYANALGASVQFVVYTNGGVWNVQRRMKQGWAPVVDIPRAESGLGGGTIDDLLLTIDTLAPLLHKLDEPMHGEDARIYLDSMQRFFCGHNLLTLEIDKDLRFGTDNLLRVLSVGPRDQHYCRSKLAAARRCFEEFRKRKNLGFELPEIAPDELTLHYFRALEGAMFEMIEAKADLTGADARVVRLILALLVYGSGQHDPKDSFPTIPASIHDAFRDFLAHVLAAQFNIELPDALEAELTSDMKHFCRPAWERVIEEERVENRAALTDLVRVVISALCFWRRWRKRDRS